MAATYHDQFDTMNLGAPQRGGEAAAQFNRVGGGAPPPYRAGGGRGEEFDTTKLGAPHRAGGGEAEGAQFNTANLGAPVRVPISSKNKVGAGIGTQERGYGAAPQESVNQVHSGQSPMMTEVGKKKDLTSGGRMDKRVVIAMLVLRVVAAVALIIGLALLASDSQTVNTSVVDYRSSTNTKYALAVSILGALYSIYEVISIAMRLIMGSLLLPGIASLWVSYIGDQVVVVLLLTGASAAAGFFRSLHEILISPDVVTTYCDLYGSFCEQGAAAIALIYIGFIFVALSLVISSYCFYKKKT